MSAPSIEVAPPEPAWRPLFARAFQPHLSALETFLERERAQLPHWLVVAFGLGIALWFGLDGPLRWSSAILLALGVALSGQAAGHRTGRVLLFGGLAVALGLGSMWWRSSRVAAPVLARPTVIQFDAAVERVELRSAREDARLTLAPLDPALPPRVRVTVPMVVGESLHEGGRVSLRARLQPPPPMMFPGTHDFARDSWFAGIGAVGKALGEPTIVEPGRAPPLDRVRRAIEARIEARLDGAEAGLATALATGTQAAVPEDDAEAMRRSGLTHLLSVSGLHIAAVVGAAMLIVMRLLALSPRIALRFNLVLVAAGAGAAAGIAYTLLTGVGSSRVDLQACKLEYSIVSPK